VGVMLDTKRQMETHLLQRHYDGFLKKGRIRGRSAGGMGAQSQSMDSSGLVWLLAGIGIIVIMGVTIALFYS
jgi:preprotein translocase subunit SecY